MSLCRGIVCCCLFVVIISSWVATGCGRFGIEHLQPATDTDADSVADVLDHAQIMGNEDVGQAQAVTVRADRCVFIHVDFYGYQDTMYFWSDANRSYFKECLVAGRTDYIYGSGTVYFDACEIRSWGGGWITAPSTSADQD